MGCTASRIDVDERVLACKERKRLIKELVEIRAEFADAQFTYLRALKNMGVTLRQFTESESLEPESADSFSPETPPSPPLPLPPSPPPPPSFSPDSIQSEEDENDDISVEDSSAIDADDELTPPSSMRKIMDGFEPSAPLENLKQGSVDEEDRIHREEASLMGRGAMDISLAQIPQERDDFLDDESATTRWQAKDAERLTTMQWKNKSLHCIIKELDYYFLKAFDCGSNVAVLMDASNGDKLPSQHTSEIKRKKNSSTKVFSALSWSWSSRSMQLRKDASEVGNLSDPCNPGGNQVTLEKLSNLEQNLYKQVKEEEAVRLEHDKKLSVLQKQDGNFDAVKFEKLRSSIEELGDDMRRLQHSICSIYSSILEAIDVELYPQLVAITSGTKYMWTKMHEFHQAQHDIFQNFCHLNDELLPDLTTDYHRQATYQLEAELNIWLTSFGKLVNFQREYALILSQWILRTDCLVEDHSKKGYSSVIRKFCEEWQLACTRLPDKMVLDAIKSFLLAIQSIVQHQSEENNLRKKCAKLEKRLEKELIFLDEMEGKLADPQRELSPRDPVSVKRAKIDVLKKQVSFEREKYCKSVHATRVMTLSKLKTNLPNVFLALMEFSSAYALALEAIRIQEEAVVDDQS